MRSLEGLIRHLKTRGVISSSLLEDAFRNVDREDFILPESLPERYEDYPLPILCGQTISQPFTVAFMMGLLEVERGQSILDIGSGSGWTTALLASLTGPGGSVTGTERHGELVKFGRCNLAKYPFDWAEIRPAGPYLGIPDSTFDRILVSAAAPDFPDDLPEQLNMNGILVIPVSHSIWKITKRQDGLRCGEYGGFSFVPLVY